MSLENLEWAFRPTTFVAANWHPVTVVSHMLDCELFGVQTGGGLWRLGPRGHHLTSVLFHALNTALLFLVLRLMTGALWPSALVAALFGWHPLHVESVAWIAERKDVLSTLFWLLTMLAYWAYVRERSIKYYLLALLSLAIGLLSKPMLVTLPCVLLLLDVWPLERFRNVQPWSKSAWRRAGRLTLEKAPMFALVGMASVWTIKAQTSFGALPSVKQFSLLERFANAMVSYTVYLWSMIVPRNLAPHYPMKEQFDLTAPGLLALAVLIVISAYVLSVVKTAPYLAVGWFWYVGTIFPVIGFVQAGQQGMADRFTYVPSIGIFIMLAWGLKSLLRRDSALVLPVATATVLWLAVLSYLTFDQIGYWKNTKTLFAHTLAVTENNYMANYGLGTYYLYESSSPEKALVHFNAALAIVPDSALAHYQRGVVLAKLKRPREAIVAFQKAIQEDFPKAWMPHAAIARALCQLNRYAEAEPHFRKALSLGPENAEVQFGLAQILIRKGEIATAVQMLQKLIRDAPSNIPAETTLARIYATHPNSAFRNGPEAVNLASAANRATRSIHPKILDTLAAAYAENGQFDSALKAAKAARQRANRQSVVGDQANRQDLATGWRDFARSVEQRMRLYAKGLPYREDPATFTF